LHLTYCSNIHPGESWLETLHNIRFEATKVKAQIRPNEPFGLGLRLSALAAQELLASDGALAELRAELDRLGLYVFTLNGFPYGPFHGTSVKQQVYRPDWREPERVRYTELLIEVLAALLPAGVSGSISTVPIGFRPEIADRATVARCVANVLDCAASLWRVREQSGADIALAIEPEPACYLETTQEAIRFFERELWSREALLRFANATGLSSGRAEIVLRNHVGLCLDTCHAAVEFEDAKQTVGALRASGIRIAKVQATTGLHVEPLDAARIDALRAFADPVYLHQVVARTTSADGRKELSRFVDLDAAFAALASGALSAECWRVHFHVPVFERALGPFTNTQEFLRECIEELLAYELCDQFEVETYTWSVLPERYRTRALSEMIAAELRWTESELRRGWSRA
jgi:sugar phosphate isomerase/epimerase